MQNIEAIGKFLGKLSIVSQSELHCALILLLKFANSAISNEMSLLAVCGNGPEIYDY